MSALPDRLRHAKHVGKPHPGCAVCWAKLDPTAELHSDGTVSIQKGCSVGTTTAVLENWVGYALRTTRPAPLTVSAAEVSVASVNEATPHDTRSDRSCWALAW